jgi:flagellar basal-body rod protein FlgF
VARIRLVNPPQGQLVRGEDGLFRARNGANLPADASVTVTSGALESSNVNAVDAMVRMIDYSRYYEHQVKLMKLASENDAASARLMRMSS